MSGEMFAELSFDQRMSFYFPDTDTWRSGSWGFLEKQLSASERQVVDNNLPADKSSYTNQQVLNQFALDVYGSSMQGDSAQGKMEGQRMLTLAVDPLNSNFAEISEAVSSGPTYVLYENDPKIDYLKGDKLQNTTLRGKEIGPGGARIMAATAMRGDKKKSYLLFELAQSPKGAQDWMYRAAYSIGDLNLDTDTFKAIQESR